MAKAENTENQEVPAEAKGLAKTYFDEQGEKSRQQIARGGKEVEISLTNKNNVRFTKDFGKYFKAGDELTGISDMALAIYDKAKVIEKL